MLKSRAEPRLSNTVNTRSLGEIPTSRQESYRPYRNSPGVTCDN